MAIAASLHAMREMKNDGARLGAVTVFANSRSAPGELRYCAEHSGAIAAVTQPDYASIIVAALPKARAVFVICPWRRREVRLVTDLPRSTLEKAAKKPIARRVAQRIRSGERQSGGRSQLKCEDPERATARWESRLGAQIGSQSNTSCDLSSP